jgi:hypothetical protein
MSITSWTATGGAWDDPAFERAWDGPAIAPAKGDLTLSSSIPVGKREFFISPGVANLEIVQSYQWDQLTSSWVDSTGDWNTGPVPQLAVGSSISPDKADLTFTAYAPDIGRMYKFVVTAPTLTLTGFAPTDGTGFVISPENASIQILQTYSWDDYGGTWADAYTDWETSGSPYVPSAVETGQNQPDAGSLTLTGSSPDFRLSKLWYVPSGSLALTGFVPTEVAGHIFTPDAANLTGLGTTSWADTSGDWASTSNTWGTGTLFPTVGVTYAFTIDSAGNLVFTPYEPQWPFVSDPNYIAKVLIS